MEKYLDVFLNGYYNYGHYLISEVINPSWHNYFYWLIGISLFFFVLEIFFPWHKSHKAFRKDFWLDMFYMFFNFFLFSLIIYNASSDVVVTLFNDALASIGITNVVALNVMDWPLWTHLVVGFIIRDFVQWWVHRLLHKIPALWEFHKVHHSVEQMGFAAHLRFHWMETIVYRTIEYIPLALIGIGLRDFFIIHIFSLAIGHFNHSNIKMNLGPLKYVFNNPQMHVWHHAQNLPKEKRNGVNFGLSLSIWDYIFGTNFIPHEGRDIKLGFSKMEEFPKNFYKQMTYGFRRKKT